MPAYVVVEIKVKDTETYERYKQLTPASIARSSLSSSSPVDAISAMLFLMNCSKGASK